MVTFDRNFCLLSLLTHIYRITVKLTAQSLANINQHQKIEKQLASLPDFFRSLPFYKLDRSEWSFYLYGNKEVANWSHFNSIDGPGWGDKICFAFSYFWCRYNCADDLRLILFIKRYFKVDREQIYLIHVLVMVIRVF